MTPAERTLVQSALDRLRGRIPAASDAEIRTNAALDLRAALAPGGEADPEKEAAPDADA